MDFFRQTPFIVERDPELLKQTGWLTNQSRELATAIQNRNRHLLDARNATTQQGGFSTSQFRSMLHLPIETEYLATLEAPLEPPQSVGSRVIVKQPNGYRAILFVQHGCQYYTAARLAKHAHCMPVDGILFHHAVEMLLKGGLLQKRTLSDVEEMRHWLKKMWRAFKEDFPEPQLKRHDGIISSLAKYDDLRYWDVASAGMTSQWEAPAQPVITYGTGKSPKQFALVVSDIDDLVVDILKAAGWNPGTFMGTNPFALEAITRHNKYAEFLTTRF